MRKKPAFAWWMVIVVALAMMEVPALLLAGLVRLAEGFPIWLLLVGSVGAGMWICGSRIDLLSLSRPAEDEMAEEERVRRTRLASLRHEAEQMEVTLRDLRALRLPEQETTRARWAEIDLENALDNTRRAMAEERAALIQVEAVRWLSELEPLLKEIDRLSEEGIRQWLARLAAHRSRGIDIHGRLRADREASELPSALATSDLLTESLTELDAIRGDLLTRRAEFLAHRASPPCRTGAEHPSVERMQELLARARARREVRSWAAED